MSKTPKRAQLILDAFGEGRWAGLGNRLGAQLLDAWLVYLPLSLVLMPLFEKIVHWKFGTLIGFSFVALPPLVAVYQTQFIDGANRLTPGRAIVGIAVVDATSGQRIDFGRAYWRCVLSLLGSWLIIPNLLVRYTRRKQSIADLLAHTVVVHYRQPVPMRTRAPGEPIPTRAEAAKAAFDEDVLASCWRRTAAQALDGLLWLGGSIAILAVLVATHTDAPDANAPMPIILDYMITLAALGILCAYHALFTGSRLVATLGRDALHIAVVDASTGRSIGFRRAYLRAVCSLVGSALIFPSLIAAYNPRKQSWADRVAHTVVVRHAENYRGMEKVTESFIVAFIIAILASIIVPASRMQAHRDHNYRQIEAIQSDLQHYAGLLQTRPRQEGAVSPGLDSLGYVPQSQSTRYVLSRAGVLYAEFALDNQRSYLSLYPEHDAATGRTAWRCRYLGLGKYYHPSDCQESPEADPVSAGLSE
jgi:uncharacterized RDD family membrane protein YckC